MLGVCCWEGPGSAVRAQSSQQGQKALHAVLHCMKGQKRSLELFSQTADFRKTEEYSCTHCNAMPSSRALQIQNATNAHVVQLAPSLLPW